MIQAHTSSLPVFGSVAYTGVHIVTLNQSYDWQVTAATVYDGNMLPNSTSLDSVWPTADAAPTAVFTDVRQHPKQYAT